MTASGPPGVVTGYLSIDHSVAIRVGLEPGRTALVGRRLTGEDGRPGGTVSQVVLGLAEQRCPVAALSWVGDDRNGSRIVGDLAAAGVEVDGIDRCSLDRTPTTWLCYAPDGTSYCVYDPGGPLPTRLTAAQIDLLAAAPWCVVTVGPPGPTAELLDRVGPDTMLVWSVKADPLSFTVPLVERLAAAARVIVWSHAETGFLTVILGESWRARCLQRGSLLIETRGAGGCCYIDPDGEHAVPAPVHVPIQDPTGAGDRMIAGLLGGLLRGEPVETAVRAGGEAAARFLAERARDEGGLEPNGPRRTYVGGD